MVFPLDDFGGHPGRGADFVFGSGFVLGELEGVPEVADLDVSPEVDEDVIALDVPVDLSPLVDGLEPLHYLPDNVGDDVLFLYPFEVLQHFVEAAVLHELYEHEQGFLEGVGKVVLDDVLRLAQLHHRDLLP